MDSLIIGVVLVIIAWRAFYLAKIHREENKRQHEVTQQGLIIDRITKATGALDKNDNDGNPLIAKRIVGIYALERIALKRITQDSISDHVKIMKILCFYVRHNCPLKDKKTKAVKMDEIKPREDIQEALKIVTRQWSKGDEHLAEEYRQGYTIDLHDSDLQGADLRVADLSEASLCGANLSGAELYDGNLSGARMEDTNLSGASLMRSNLSNAWLSRANLNGAYLGMANLNGVFLDVDIKYAHTSGAFAFKGDFTRCKNLTQEQIDWMFCGIGVKIPNDFTRPDHWPTDDIDEGEFENAYKEWCDKKRESRKSK